MPSTQPLCCFLSEELLTYGGVECPEMATWPWMLLKAGTSLASMCVPAEQLAIGE